MKFGVNLGSKWIPQHYNSLNSCYDLELFLECPLNASAVLILKVYQCSFKFSIFILHFFLCLHTLAHTLCSSKLFLTLYNCMLYYCSHFLFQFTSSGKLSQRRLLQLIVSTNQLYDYAVPPSLVSFSVLESLTYGKRWGQKPWGF